ncbi:MAG: hypothetical protein IBJ13_12400 [Sphingopyxis sp.]|nr:hypothetical protein [Sphingopyxis sp.]
MTDETPPEQQPFDEAEYRRRQRSRANMMAWMLGGLAILFFLITIAKIQVFQ